METEIWKDIKGYNWKYQISSLWNVKSLNYNHSWKEKLLKNEILKSWYINISLCKFWKVKRFLVHRLVCLTFLNNLENKE